MCDSKLPLVYMDTGYLLSNKYCSVQSTTAKMGLGPIAFATFLPP